MPCIHIPRAAFDPATGFSEGRAFFEREGKYGLLDKAGQVMVEPRFDHHDHMKFEDGISFPEWHRIR